MALASIFQPLKPYTPPKPSGLRSLYGTQPTSMSAPASTIEEGVNFNTYGQAPGEAGTRGPFTPPGASNPADPFGPLPASDIGGYPGAAGAYLDPKYASGNGGGNSGGGSGGGYGNWNESDPILAQIRALNARQIAQAKNAALSARKQAEIAQGFMDGYTYADEATREAARQNPFSALAQLFTNHDERAHSLDEGLNKSNLFYSGERVKQIGREGRQYTLEQSNANQSFQQRLGQIAQMVLDAELAAQEREIQGASDAYGRALQMALAGGGGLAGLMGGGGGGGSNYQWSPEAIANAARYGTSVDAINQAIADTLAQRGWGPYSGSGGPEAPRIMKEGQVFTDDNGRRYVEVKVGTPQGNSTERIYLP